MAPDKVASIYCKTIAAINSCKTLKQLEMATAYSNRATAMMIKHKANQEIVEQFQSEISNAMQTMGVVLLKKGYATHGYATN